MHAREEVERRLVEGSGWRLSGADGAHVRARRARPLVLSEHRVGEDREGVRHVTRVLGVHVNIRRVMLLERTVHVDRELLRTRETDARLPLRQGRCRTFGFDHHRADRTIIVQLGHLEFDGDARRHLETHPRRGPVGQGFEVAVGVAWLEIAAAQDLGMHVTHVHKGWLPLAVRHTDATGKLGRWRLRPK